MKKKLRKSPYYTKQKFWLSLTLVASLIVVFAVQIKQPSNSRDWEEEFAVQPTVRVQDSVVTINNIRDWKYSDSDIISKEYISRSYDVSKLKQAWFMLEPFGKFDGVAHTYFVFDFEDQEPVSFSIEARREKGEVYTAFTGLFRKFEMIYLWGTEQDFTVGRTLYKKNNVYMFPLITSDNFDKKLFMELIYKTQALYEQPKFYNTVTSNCTNNLADFANEVKSGTVPFHYSRYLTGYSGQFLYDLGYIPHDKSYDQIREKYYINDFVNENYGDESLSEELRAHLLDNS